MKRLLTLTLSLLFAASALANNIQVTNGPRLVKDNLVGDNVLQVMFDLSWDNSWNLSNPGNYDAAWVFVKFRIGAGDFRHGYLKDASEHSVGAASNPTANNVAIKCGTSTTARGKRNVGVFIYRTKPNTFGTMSLKDVTLHVDVSGLYMDPSTIVSVRVYAIEMVYIPAGGFTLGDNVAASRLQRFGNKLNFIDPNPSRLDFSDIKAPDLGGSSSIIPVMTSGTTPTGAVNASTTFGTDSAYSVFTQYPQESRYWSPKEIKNPDMNLNWHWISYSYPDGVTQRATWMTLLMQRGDTVKGFYVEGSTDGNVWTPIHGNNELIYDVAIKNAPSSFFGDHQYTRVVFDNPESYRHYRFNFCVRGNFKLYDIRLMNTPIEKINRIDGEEELLWADWNGDQVQNRDGATMAVLPATYPKGTKAFYVLKHEVTQSAYVDFLNSLNFNQQKNCSNAISNDDLATAFAGVVGPDGAVNSYVYTNQGRSSIRLNKSGTLDPAVYACYTTASAPATLNNDDNGGCIAMFGANWADHSAYLDWAGLRPLSELEYEKAARGPETSIPYEYAWGWNELESSSNQGRRVTSVANPFKVNELPKGAITSIIPNYVSVEPATARSTNSGSVKGYYPIRVGAFATATSTREDAGAGYYGVLHMSDNVPEFYINVSDEKGREFTGEHGDGQITSDGQHNVKGWPVYKALSYEGVGFRGVAISRFTKSGAILTSVITDILPISDRSYANNNSKHRNCWAGIRGGRTAE